jgi:type I restriction-modification system DNA methylase subunit
MFSPSINEWTFTADVASQINAILRDRPNMRFSNVQVEERGRGSRKRRDLTVYDRQNKIVLTGEVKMPDSPEGRSPYQEALVMDAHDKANRIGVEHFFTWNVNKCVLWRTFERGKPITERYEEELNVFPSPIRRSNELKHPLVKDQLNRFLFRFLDRCSALVTGEEPLKLFPLDDKFIRVWEAGLLPLVADTLHAIGEHYEKNRHFKNELDKWMRDEQGLILSSDEAVLRENLERAAKLSCYVLANKIVFYKALRRRFTKMKALKIPASIKTGRALQLTLDEYFDQAMRESSDYETVFTGNFGDTLPFISDMSVDDWRSLSEQTDAFDFTQINYEVIGQIFEGLLSTTERHKFGQHYTRSEVVDLINTFCVRDAKATVLDPACGGGTFLVRAYQRKSDLSNSKLTHQRLISSLYGLDISAYPAHLTTVNLATRDLIEEANYPLVARQDFLTVNPGEAVFNVPFGAAGKGEQIAWMELPKVDAVVGNPPYVRQEKINEYYGKGYKNLLQEGAQRDAPGVNLSGRSDILCYFFTHGGAFLKDGGYMGLLTSSNWLDTAYGFALQKYLLDNYEIIAILESNCEPWFTGARVTTAATILRKQPDATKRYMNLARFVWLKQPLKEFLTYAHTEDDRRLTFEDLRVRVMSLTEDEETHAWRVRVRSQDELYCTGCLPITISEGEESEDEEGIADADSDRRAATARHLPGVREEQHEIRTGDYIGYKWGIFLRAPEIFFKLLKRGGDHFVPLGQIAEVRFGIKSGCDKFFFPRDITHKALVDSRDEREFKDRYGIRRSETNKVHIVLAGDGTQHLIEAKYLEPEVHSLMELDSVEIDLQRVARQILLVSKPKEQINDTYVRKYIKWGEQQGFNLGSTCANRPIWYDLSASRRGDMFWAMAQQYRHIVPLNTQSLICNHNLFDVFTLNGIPQEVLAAVLNSTIVVLFKHQFGRYMGREGNLKTEVIDVKMMFVPDPRNITSSVRRRLGLAFDSMRKRKALPMVDVDSTEIEWTGELALPDRQQLDDAVLELLGITNAKERVTLRHELYEEITKLYRQIRVAERKMQRYRSETARGGRVTPQSIVTEIWENLEAPFIYHTPLDFIPKGAHSEEFDLPAGRARIVKGNWFEPDSLQIGDHRLEIGDLGRCQFVKELNTIGITGSIRVPIQPATCQLALNEYKAYVEQTTNEFMRLAAAYTAEEAMQERVVRELWKKTKM